ncbi:MAG: CPBP family intramembrane metalloprotease [Anaerolineae bacterium]|nr:CPBP family intramembrane metalloprotease [Anaerolineae bacterium]
MYPQPPNDDQFDVIPPTGSPHFEDEERESVRVPTSYRGSSNDPTFGYLIALALAVGLTPVLPANGDMRYTLVWAVMAGFGVLGWLFGTFQRIEQEAPENLAWGIIFGIIVGAPLLLVGGSALTTTVERLFSIETAGTLHALPAGVVLAYLVFVMPVAETLFFRGLMQERRAFWLVGALSTVWSLVLFAPMLDLLNFPGVAIMIGIALLLMNMIYSYVRERNGLAAAWLCQITVNILVLFVPFISR